LKKSEVIDSTKAILEEYTTRLTLRQIFYRLVSKHIIENTMNNYKYLSKLLVQARLDGQIPFDAIEDRTRRFTTEVVWAIKNSHLQYHHPYWHWKERTPEQHFNDFLTTLKKADKFFELPRWKGQPKYVEVWSEKEALSGLFYEITNEHHITLATCRGYPSLTFMHKAEQRLEDIEEDIVILYFGDYDPSGEDIFRHIQDTLKMFCIDAEFEKVAITMEQINEYDIPPMPTKRSDARSAKFVERYGDVAVELDAIEPDTLQNIIATSIDKHFDDDEYDKTTKRQDKEQKTIKKMIEDVLGKNK